MHTLSNTLLRLGAMAALVIVAGLTGCATTEEAPDLDRSLDHRWSEDIEVMFDTLPRKHKNLFFRLSEEEYRRRLVELNERAAELNAPEFEIALRRILADVGDAHTNISFARDAVFPLYFQAFEEGLFVVGAVPGYAEHIGARLVRVEGTDVTAFRDMAREITPHDNASQLDMWAPVYLNIPTVLAGLGVTDSQSEVSYTLTRPDQTSEYRVTVASVGRESVSRLVSIRERLAEQGVSLPISRRNTDAIYRHEYRPEYDAVYVQYNACREDEAYPMTEFVDDVFGAARREQARKLVVDLRRNSGGDSRVLHPFIDATVDWVEGGRTGGASDATGAAGAADPTGNAANGTAGNGTAGNGTAGAAARELYVLIGRNTFSSAVLNAIALEQEAGAVFVGEPTGGRPNHYGEIKSLQLPGLGRTLTYSTKYFDNYEAGDPPALMPDIEAPLSFEAYMHGRDRALEAALGR